MTIIDGKQLAKDIQSEIKEEVEKFCESHKNPPKLVAVKVGHNPASASYVRNKIRSCERVGFESEVVQLEEDISEKELLDKVEALNQDDSVDGYIVQLPLPRHIDEEKVTLAIDPKKDVDGFHPYNFGLMVLGQDSFLPATPYGIVMMLERYNIETKGKHVVVLGRSNIVGRPISILLSSRGKDATVTVTHSKTKELKEIVQSADIIIAAIGKPNFVSADMVKEGAVIIDVGINRIEDLARERGYRLVGDVDFDQVKDKCSFITPVPGGVGPMTVTALLLNTLKSAKQRQG